MSQLEINSRAQSVAMRSKSASITTEIRAEESDHNIFQSVGANFSLLANVPGAVPISDYGSSGQNNPGIIDVDYHVNLNGFYHKTWMYSSMKKTKPQLVVRRGQPFRLGIEVDAPISHSEQLKMVFHAKDQESSVPDESAHFEISPPKAPFMFITKNKWSAIWDFISPDGKILYLQILPNHDSIVGKWHMEIFFESRVGEASWKTEEPMMVIFNAWNKNDEAFTPKFSQRNEYVMRDYGKIFRGVRNSVSPTLWKYSHYDTDVLDFATDAMCKFGKIEISECKVLNKIPRYIAESVQEVLIEKSGTEGGRDWFGTSSIIREYRKTERPVKVQPFVISAVIVSCLRALGVASRNVTCYNWAVNSSEIKTVDLLYTSNSFVDVNTRKDFAIACHFVYAEVWMKGTFNDLNFTGWAGLTPKHGPFPMEFLDKEIPDDPENDRRFFDGGFNSECIVWKYFGLNIPMKMVAVEFDRVASLVVTKSISSWGMENITSSRKLIKETTKEERIKQIQDYPRTDPIFSKSYSNEDFRDVNYKFLIKKNSRIDESIQVTLALNNVSKEFTYNLEMRIMVFSITSAGEFIYNVKEDRKILTLDPDSCIKVFKMINDEKKILARKYTVAVPPSEFSHKLSEDCIFKITGQIYVREKAFDFFSCDYLRVILPEIEPFPKVNAKNVVEVSFINTTREILERATITLEELDRKRTTTITKYKVTPTTLIRAQYSLWPHKKGIYHLAATIGTRFWKTHCFARIQIRPEATHLPQLHWLWV